MEKEITGNDEKQADMNTEKEAVREESMDKHLSDEVSEIKAWIDDSSGGKVKYLQNREITKRDLTQDTRR